MLCMLKIEGAWAELASGDAKVTNCFVHTYVYFLWHVCTYVNDVKVNLRSL
jgi:hypothetical protein